MLQPLGGHWGTGRAALGRVSALRNKRSFRNYYRLFRNNPLPSLLPNCQAQLGKCFPIAPSFDTRILFPCLSVPQSAVTGVWAVAGCWMGKTGNWGCGLVAAGRSTSSASQPHQFISCYQAADLELALGAERVPFQEYLIKSHLQEHLRTENTELAQIQPIWTRSNICWATTRSFLLFLYWKPFSWDSRIC